MAQAHVLSWVNPTTYTDGTAAPATDIAGYAIAFDGGTAQVVTEAEATSLDLTTLSAWAGLKTGTHTVTIAVVSKEGVVGLASAPISFPILGVFTAPSSVSIA